MSRAEQHLPGEWAGRGGGCGESVYRCPMSKQSGVHQTLQRGAHVRRHLELLQQGHHGRALQVEPMNPALKAPGPWDKALETVIR